MNSLEIGIVADFCPECQDVRAFQLERVLRPFKILFIPAGDGMFHTCVATCTVCGFEARTDPLRYRTVLGTGKQREELTLDKLIGVTHPDFFDRYETLLEAHPSRPGPLTPLGKKEIEQILLKYEEPADEICRGTWLDWIAGIWIVLTVLLPGALFAYASTNQINPLFISLEIWSGGLFVLLLSCTLYQIHRSRFRELNRKLVVDLSETFVTYAVQKLDIEAVIEDLKEQDLWVAHLNPDKLWNEIVYMREYSRDGKQTEESNGPRDIVPEDRELIDENYAMEQQEMQEERPVRDCFRETYPEAEKKLSVRSRIDLFAGISVAVTLLLPVLFYFGLPRSGYPVLETNALSITGGTAILMVVVTLLLVFTSRYRYKKFSLLPELRKKLRSQNPESEVLLRCLENMKSLGLELGKQISLENLQ